MGMFKKDVNSQGALDHSAKLRADRDRFRQERLWRPEVPALIVLNHLERDAAREVYDTMEAVMKVEHERRTGEPMSLAGLNSASVVDEIVTAINNSRVQQTMENLSTLRDGKARYS